MHEIFQQDGEVKPYLSVAERQPKFLAKFGLEQGYRIENSVKEHLALCPQLAELYQKAMEAGMDLATFPSIEPIFCFEARLLDENDVVLAEASALRRIDVSNPFSFQEYFWESGETAAYQRLMARLGFGSETLLADEQRDMDAHGVQSQVTDASEDSAKEEEEDNAKAASDSDAEEPTPADATPVENAGTEDTPEETPKATSEPSKSKKAENPAKPPTGRTRTPKATANSSEVQDAVLRQIRNLAAQRGIEPPEVATKAEAKEALKLLRATPAPT